MGETERTAAAQSLTREPRARVTIDWTDPYRDVSITTVTNDENRVSWPNQVADNIETVPYKWFSADGTTPISAGMHPMPSTDALATSYQVGWWGATEAGVGGAFGTPYPSLTLWFSSRPVRKIRVVGDDQYGEYPVDFTVTVYDQYGATLYTESVTGNAAVVYESDITALGISGAVRMALVISKWSDAGRVVKIVEFFSSVIDTYTGDDIDSISILEESEIAEGSLPVGNISANECDVALQNLDDDFFPGNTDSEYASLMLRNRKITVELGWVIADGTTEYETMGTYWSGDWKIDELGTTAETSARDRMELLRKSTYVPADVYTDETLYALLVRVLEDAKLTIKDLTYSIDSELAGADFTIPYAVFDRASHFETVRRICQAAMAFAYVSRDDTVTIIGPTAAGAVGATPYAITKDYYFDNVQPARSEELANVIEVTTQPLEAAGSATTVYTSSEDITLTGGTTETISIKYSFTEPDVAVLNGSASLTGATSAYISSVTYYSWGADVTVGTVVDDTFKITVSGKLLSVSGAETVTARDEDSVGQFGELVYDKIKDNKLLQTRALAEKISTTLVGTYAELRKDADVSWCGDTAMAVGDGFRIPIYQKGGIDSQIVCKVTRNKITFDGAFRMQTTGRYIQDYAAPVAYVKYQETDGASEEWQDTDGGSTTYQDADE